VDSPELRTNAQLFERLDEWKRKGSREGKPEYGMQAEPLLLVPRERWAPAPLHIILGLWPDLYELILAHARRHDSNSDQQVELAAKRDQALGLVNTLKEEVSVVEELHKEAIANLKLANTHRQNHFASIGNPAVNTTSWATAKKRFNLAAAQKPAFDEWVTWRTNVTSGEKEKKTQVSTGLARALALDSPFPRRRSP